MPSIQYQTHVLNTLLNTRVQYNINHNYVFNANTCVQYNIKHNVSNTKSNTRFQYDTKHIFAIHYYTHVSNIILNILMFSTQYRTHVCNIILNVMFPIQYQPYMFSKENQIYAFNKIRNTCFQYTVKHIGPVQY